MDFNSDIRVLIAKHRDTPYYVREQLGRDNNFEVKQAVASSSYTPKYILRQLVVNNNDERIKKAIIYNDPWYSVENTDKYIKILQDFLSKSNLAATWNIDNDLNSSIPLQELSEKIAIDKLPQTKEYRIRLAEAEDTPAYILEKLIESPEIKIRYILANRGDLRLDLSDKLWAELVIDPNRYSITARIAKQSNEYTLVNLGKDIEAIPFFIQHYAENDNAFSRYIVLSHPSLPHYLFNKYAKSKSWLERYALTQNPNTPKHIKQTLTQDANKIVRTATKSKGAISSTLTEPRIPQTITDNERLLATLKVLTKPLTEYFTDPDAWEIKESYQETIWRVKKKTAFFSDFLEDNGILNRISVDSFTRRFQMQACREFSGEKFNSQLIDPLVTEESIRMSQNLIALLKQNLYKLEAYTINYKRSQNLFPLIVGQTVKEDWLGVSIALGSQYRKEIQPSNINFESINVASHFIPMITSLKPIIDNLYPSVRLNLALPYSSGYNPEISQGIIWKTAKSKELLIEELLKSANFIQNIEFNEQKHHYTDINRFYLSFLENPSIYAIGYNHELRSLLYGHEKYTIGTTPEKDWLVLKAYITDAP